MTVYCEGVSACHVLGTLTHRLFPTSVSALFSLPLSPSSTVAPQEQLGIVNGLGDHITVSKETWRQDPRGRLKENAEQMIRQRHRETRHLNSSRQHTSEAAERLM